MFRGLVALAGAAALSLCSSATAGGPTPGVLFGSPGIAVAGGAHVVATAKGGDTLVRLVRDSDRRILRSRLLPGRLGVPVVTIPGAVEGTWQNGRRLVLGSSVYENRRTTTFVTLDTRTLEPLRRLSLRGSFAFDAVSGDGRKLFVAHFPAGASSFEYVVRSVDMRTGRVGDPIVDKSAGGAEMSGLPLSRTWSRDGAWAYTLYSREGSFAFVHALDTRHRAARCLALPWRGSAQHGLETVRMAVDRGGTLTLSKPGVGVLARIDTRTFRIDVVRDPVPTSS